MTMETLHSSRIAPVDHHLRPLTTYSSPSSVIVADIVVASDDATSGSVMEKQERMRPSRSGSSQVCFCSGVPNMCSSSMLPVSGALQFIASGMRNGERPEISAIGA